MNTTNISQPSTTLQMPIAQIPMEVVDLSGPPLQMSVIPHPSVHVAAVPMNVSATVTASLSSSSPIQGPSGERPATLHVTLADVTIFIRTLVELMSGVRSNPATVEMLVVKAALQLFSLSGDDFIKMGKPLTTKDKSMTKP